MRMRTSKLLLLCGAIAIVMLVGANAEAGRRSPQGEEGIVDPTAEGQKGYGFIHISITNLEQQKEPNEVFGDIAATLRLRVRDQVAVFQTKIPDSFLGTGSDGSGTISDLQLRFLILEAFKSNDDRFGGIVADKFFPGELLTMTVKVLSDDVACAAATAADPVVGCPLGPVPGSATPLTPVILVADLTIAFGTTTP